MGKWIEVANDELWATYSELALNMVLVVLLELLLQDRRLPASACSLYVYSDGLGLASVGRDRSLHTNPDAKRRIACPTRATGQRQHTFFVLGMLLANINPQAKSEER